MGTLPEHREPINHTLLVFFREGGGGKTGNRIRNGSCLNKMFNAR